MKLRFRYFYYEQKRILRYIPQMIAGAIVLALLAGAIAFCAVWKLSDTDALSAAPVALVIDQDSENTRYAVEIIGQMKSTSEHFRFIEMTEEDAMNALQTGTVCAVMLLSDEVLSSIIDGTNLHIPILLSDSDVLSAILLQELAAAGAKTLSSAQAGTYTMTELYINAGISDALPNAYMELDLRNLQYALARDDLFYSLNASPTGSVSTLTYYLSTGILFLFLMSGICCSRFYEKKSKAQTLKLRSAHIGSFTECISGYCGVLLYQLIPFCLLLCYLTWRLICKGLQASAYGSILFLALFFLLTTSAYLFFLLEAAPTAAASVPLIFLVTILLMLLGGCFIPTAFLPEQLLCLRNVLPSVDLMHQLFHMFAYDNHTVYQYPQLFDTVCIRLLLFTLLFFFAGTLIHAIRRHRQ